MKKIFVITMLIIFALNAKADDIFATGYYLQNDQKVAAVYKNGEIIYTVSHEGMNATPKTIVCDENKNIYWMINIYQGTSFKYTEVWKNNLLYVSTQGMSGVRIIDIYCLDDTLYYAGYQNNEDTISVATVWKGNGFTPHWTLGDGVHDSYLYDAEVDKSTGTPYFCGKIQEDRTKAVVWKEQELYYKYDIENLSPYITVTYSSVSEISIDQGNVYTLGDYEVSITDDDEVGYDAIWKNNEVIQESSLENGMLSKLCAFDGDYYYCYIWPHGMEYTIVKNGSYTPLLQFPFNGSAGANKIKTVASDIYVLGLFENKGCIWKNFEVLMQPENCAELFDMVVVETSNPPSNYYGYLCQPDSAVIELDPNSNMGSEYGDFHARFTYHPNGLLNTQSAYSILSGSSADYDHFYRFYYDSDYHVIQQNDTYYGDWGAGPYQNNYIYEDGLLMTYTRHLNNYHEDNTLILWDSISYTYDELRRLNTEKRFISTTSEKTYEYNENQVVITTDGYTNETSGDWLTLSQEIRTFNEDSLLVSSQTEKYNDSTILVTYGYDGQRHRTSILTQKLNNGVWENQKLVQYHFNPYGRLTLAEIKLWQDDAFVDAHRAVYELNEMGYPATVTFEKWDGEAWVDGVWQSDFYLYDEGHLQQQNDMLYSYRNSIHKIELSYIATNNPREPLLPDNSEWYYEILNDDGTITYQHLECAADTTISTERPKIIVRTNTIYDRDAITTEVTHEYVFERDGKVYWWNKDLEEFTTLYDFTAETGDEWEIKIGLESFTMHVDSVWYHEFDGRSYRILHVSDADDLFTGNIVCGIGHLTSFFPEKLMNRGKNYRVTGLRCYWVEGNLIFKIHRDDCDAIYAELHNGINEDGPSTGSGTFVVYPNPANNILFVETVCTPSLPDQTYRITNLMGQTLLTGNISAETQQIDIAKLPAGMYFISVGGQTVKFVVK